MRSGCSSQRASVPGITTVRTPIAADYSDPTWVTSVVRKTPVSTQEVEVASVVLHKE